MSGRTALGVLLLWFIAGGILVPVDARVVPDHHGERLPRVDDELIGGLLEEDPAAASSRSRHLKHAAPGELRVQLEVELYNLQR